MTNETATANTETPAPAKKAVRKPGKKAAAKKPAAKSTGLFNESVLKLTGAECTARGKRLEVFKLIRNGMTVDQLKDKAVKHFKGESNWRNRAAVCLGVFLESKLIMVKR